MNKLFHHSVVLFLFSALPLQLHAQGTALTYQGRLNAGGVPVSGSYDMAFTLYATNITGNALAGPITNSAVNVTNGLFTTTIDFGNQFPGADRWLAIAVSTNGNGTFTTLAPRQPLTPTPYAITAGKVAGVIAVAQLPASVVTNNATGLTLSGTFTGSGANVTNVNAVTLGGISSAGFWNTNGNAGANGAFLGTTDNLPLEFKVNGQRGLRLEPGGGNSVNVIGGWAGNGVAPGVVGATISGGGAENYSLTSYSNRVESDFGSIGGGAGNNIQAYANFATIGGGGDNSIQTESSDATIGGGSGNAIQVHSLDTTIGGGYYNNIQSFCSSSLIGGGAGNAIQTNSYTATIGGGGGNTIQKNSSDSTISGGVNNNIQINSSDSTIGGGNQNTILSNSAFATIPGGQFNVATNFAYAAGRRAKAAHTGTFVWADSTDADFLSTAPNQFLMRAAGGVGINTPNPQADLHVYSANNPAVVRVQSSGTPGFGRLEFVSNPQGDINEWRPGYIQSTDNGGFTGGLAFFVNGTGAGSKFAGNEVMRIVNGSVGVNLANPAATLHVNGTAYVQGNNNWNVSNTEGDLRVGNDTYRFKVGVANAGGGAGDVWMRAQGGIQRINIKAPGGTRVLSNEAETLGVTLAANGTAWATISDRNAKKDFSPINAVDILEKLAAMPVTQWHYKWEPEETTPHIGPMAQDFKAAFYPGTDDKSITTQEADGVAFAAIQGLNEKVEARSQNTEASIQKLAAENAELKKELSEIKVLLAKLATNRN